MKQDIKWIKVKDKQYLNVKLPTILTIGCCDCGLVHDFIIIPQKADHIKFRIARDEKITKILRKKRGVVFFDQKSLKKEYGKNLDIRKHELIPISK